MSTLTFVHALPVTFYCSGYISFACSGHQISLVLWGERATTFDGDGVIDMGKEEPVIALFVGTLVKAYDGA